MRKSTGSFSEFNTFSHCEKQWEYRYTGPKVDTAPSLAMAKGTLLHGGVNSFWREGDWHPGLDLAWDVLGQKWDVEDYLEIADDVEWLLARYEEVYTDLLRNVTVKDEELELSATLPMSGVRVKGFIDRTIEINGNLWIVETKSMKDWSRLDLVTVDPQQSLYYWLAEKNGFKPYGILFDAIRTYRWKTARPTQAEVIQEKEQAWIADDVNPAEMWVKLSNELETTPAKAKLEWARGKVAEHPGNERPAHESFNQLWLDRTQEQVTAALAWAEAIVYRRDDVLQERDAIRNIGPFCKGCAYKDQCFDDMAFPANEIIMEVD